MELKLRKAREDDVDSICAILDQARARLGSLGIDQWQNGYPNRAAIENDVTRGCSYVVEDVACGAAGEAIGAGCGGGREVDASERVSGEVDAHGESNESAAGDASGTTLAQAGLLATAMITSEGEPTYDVIYGGAWLTESPSSAPCYLTVHRVAVADGATGRGVARFLLREAASMARAGGFESVRVDTHEGNAPMRGLLRACGFTECGVILLDDPLEPTRERLAFERLV